MELMPPQNLRQNLRRQGKFRQVQGSVEEGGRRTINRKTYEKSMTYGEKVNQINELQIAGVVQW